MEANLAKYRRGLQRPGEAKVPCTIKMLQIRKDKKTAGGNIYNPIGNKSKKARI